MQRIITPDTRRLALRLGLGDLAPRVVCHGYRCGCRCAGCHAQAELIAARGFTANGEIRPARRGQTTPAQPWQPKAA